MKRVQNTIFAMQSVKDFASLCFTDNVIRELIDAEHFSELVRVRSGRGGMSKDLLSVMSRALRDWALKMGATHYMHWFQPLTMHVAGKQNSLIKISRDNAVYDLSADDLLFGESDASSLPSGGLRSTFEARGVLEWDLTSFAFIKEYRGGRILYIPTKFTTFGNQALDLKSPLLSSISSLRKNAIPLVNLVNSALGLKETHGMRVMVGPEQEFFLVDRGYYEKRPDLALTGKTVLGSVGTIGEYSVEHYFGGLSERVQCFLQDLNKSLFKIGIIPSTQHREAAPNQFEVALHYDECNIISDKNLIMQEMMADIASHYGLVVLFDEKPYAGVNGSGKHTNWSVGIDGGANLFSPGETREEMIRFLFFVSVFVAAVDEYQDLLRCSVASYSNDARLSKKEAPPCVMSVYLGDNVNGILDSGFAGIRNASISKRNGINSDRNRTSPIAFTGNKFEFRATGSSQSISTVCAFINAAFSSVCKRVYDEMSKDEVNADEICIFAEKLYKSHSRIVYNDNCYSPAWLEEAARRGLEKLDTALQAIPALTRDKNVRMFESLGIFTRPELESRRNVMVSAYIRDVRLEATVMVEMVNRSIIPAVRDEIRRNSECLQVSDIGPVGQFDAIRSGFAALASAVCDLEKALRSLDGIDEFSLDDALLAQSRLVPLLDRTRAIANDLERHVDKRAWPFPSYDALLYKI